jgi:hypothetical protein
MIPTVFKVASYQEASSLNCKLLYVFIISVIRATDPANRNPCTSVF